MKTVNQIETAVNTETKSEETTMKTENQKLIARIRAKASEMKSKFVKKFPKTVKALAYTKTVSSYVVGSFLFIGSLPALLVGTALGYSLVKVKGGKYISTKTSVAVLAATAALAVVSTVTAVMVAPVALAASVVVATLACVASDVYSWFKNRKAK